MSKKDAAKAVEVLEEDQGRINEFNRLNNRSHELDATIKAKKKILEDLEDASNELMLSDEEQIRYVVGECFVHLDKEVAEARLQGMADAVKDEVQQLVGEVDGTQAKMKELKALLYGKFGTSINL
ncbi:prefoldin subunit 4, partial [Haematococcus lacustris]